MLFASALPTAPTLVSSMLLARPQLLITHISWSAPKASSHVLLKLIGCNHGLHKKREGGGLDQCQLNTRVTADDIGQELLELITCAFVYPCHAILNRCRFKSSTQVPPTDSLQNNVLPEVQAKHVAHGGVGKTHSTWRCRQNT